MDRHKFTTIAHTDHIFFSPLSEAKVDQVLDLIPAAPDDSVLDAGCGRAEMLIRLCERTGAHGIGVDSNAHFIEQARKNADGRGVEMTWHTKSVRDINVEPHSLAATLCIGSTHAFGSYHEALSALAGWTQPGGHVLIGAAYWQQPPPDDYLSHLGAPADAYGTHADNALAGNDAGLIPIYATTSNQDEWDHYEGLYLRAIERYLYGHPTDPDSSKMRRHIRNWRKGYLTWGRDVLGFGLYLFLKP